MSPSPRALLPRWGEGSRCLRLVAVSHWFVDVSLLVILIHGDCSIDGRSEHSTEMQKLVRIGARTGPFTTHYKRANRVAGRFDWQSFHWEVKMMIEAGAYHCLAFSRRLGGVATGRSFPSVRLQRRFPERSSSGSDRCRSSGRRWLRRCTNLSRCRLQTFRTS
jgi:hypothetical protein